MFGDRSWREAFYKDVSPTAAKDVQRSLFGDEDEAEEPDYLWKADFSVIEDYFRDRLRTIFARVAEKSVRLKNSKNVPLYLLFFMAGNERGAPIAMEIAESIMSRP